MNIKFLFDYLQSQRTALNIEIENQNFPADGIQKGYFNALTDFENYLKQAIELTKNESKRQDK